jgi:hypothetical protein
VRVCSQRDARDVVERLLRRERPAGGRRVQAEMLRPVRRPAEAFADQPRPDLAGRPVLGDLLEEVHLGAVMQLDLVAEIVDTHALRQAGLDIGDAVADGEGGLLDRRRPRLLHVRAGDRNRQPRRHVVGHVLHHVGRQLHRRLDRHELRAARDVFLDRVVLDLQHEGIRIRPAHLGQREEPRHRNRPDAVRGGEDVPRLVERDAVEHDLDVLERRQRDADLAHLVARQRMVRVEPDLGRQVERDRDAAGRTVVEQIAIALVGVFGRAEAGIHLDLPKLLAVAAGREAARPGSFAGKAAVGLVAPARRLEICRRVDRLDLDAARRLEARLPRLGEFGRVLLGPQLLGVAQCLCVVGHA